MVGSTQSVVIGSLLCGRSVLVPRFGRRPQPRHRRNRVPGKTQQKLAGESFARRRWQQRKGLVGEVARSAGLVSHERGNNRPLVLPCITVSQRAKYEKTSSMFACRQGAGAVDTFGLGAGDRQESKPKGVVRIATATPTCGSGTGLRNCKEVGQPRGRFFHPIDDFVMDITAAPAIARQGLHVDLTAE
jgi:hypothetical protein